MGGGGAPLRMTKWGAAQDDRGTLGLALLLEVRKVIDGYVAAIG